MLLGAASAGAAGLALSALAGSPALAASRPNSSAGLLSEHVPDDIVDGEAVVAYRGTIHVQVLDRALAARLARASQ
jgi:hypothetical protein